MAGCPFLSSIFRIILKHVDATLSEQLAQLDQICDLQKKKYPYQRLDGFCIFMRFD